VNVGSLEDELNTYEAVKTGNIQNNEVYRPPKYHDDKLSMRNLMEEVDDDINPYLPVPKVSVES